MHLVLSDILCIEGVLTYVQNRGDGHYVSVGHKLYKKLSKATSDPALKSSNMTNIHAKVDFRLYLGR